jgi:hypothetical protein
VDVDVRELASLKMPDFSYPYDVRNVPPAPPIRLRPVVESAPSPLWGWLAAIAAGFMALNFLLMPMLFMAPPGRNEIGACLACLSVGMIGAEPGLLAIAAVFAPGAAWRRHLIVGLLALAFALSGFGSFVATKLVYSHRTYFPEVLEVLPFFLLVPILFLVCQMPLWFFRSFLCWRIASREKAAADRAPQLSIAGILLATAVVAMGLSFVRLGNYLISHVDPQVESQYWWLGTGISAAFMAAFSIAVLPPFTGAVFRAKSPLLGLLGATVWMILLFGFVTVIIRWINGGWPVPVPFYPFAAIAAGFAGGLLGPLVVVRLFGYRLLWGKKAQESA